jgi:Domain of unknown function (DUF3854)
MITNLVRNVKPQIFENSAPPIPEAEQWLNKEFKSSGLHPEWEALTSWADGGDYINLITSSLLAPHWERYTPVESKQEALRKAGLNGKLRAKAKSDFRAKRKSAEKKANHAIEEIAKAYTDSAQYGGIVWKTIALDGASFSAPIIKPFKPRVTRDGKVIKYESLRAAIDEEGEKIDGGEAHPYFMPLSRRAMKLWATREGLPLAQVEEFEDFDPAFFPWACKRVRRTPVWVSEGWKSSAAIAQHGYIVISLRGVDTLKTLQTHRFFAKGQSFAIAFDMSSRGLSEEWGYSKEVKKAAYRLADALYKVQESGKVTIASWVGGFGGHAKGKGIDDYLAKEKRPAEVLAAIVERFPLSKAQVGRAVAKMPKFVWAIDSLGATIELPGENGYIGKLPTIEPGQLVALSAPMGSGKTVAIGKAIEEWLAVGGNRRVLVFSPLNSLGKQTAKACGLDHRRDYDLEGAGANEGQKLWQTALLHKGGVLCVDSAHTLPFELWDKDVLVVLDEADQCFDSVVMGPKMGGRWSVEACRVLSLLETQLKGNGAVLLAQANLSAVTLGVVAAIAELPLDSDRVIRYRFKKNANNWQIYSHIDKPAFYEALYDQAAKGKLFVVADSQKDCEALDRILYDRYPDKKIIRLDGATNEGELFREFFEAPDLWLLKEQPDIVICSPSVKSGLSIQGGVPAEDAYFSAVFGLFSHLDTESHLQLLGRFRPPVDRHFYCPASVLRTGGENRSFNDLPQAIEATHGAITGVVDPLLFELHPQTDTEKRYELILREWYVRFAAQRGAEKRVAKVVLERKLMQAGHTLKDYTRPAIAPKEIKEEIKACKAAITSQKAENLAIIVIAPGHDEEWSNRVFNSPSASAEERQEARKIKLQARFPGVEFDNIETCTAILKSPTLANRIELHALLDNPGNIPDRAKKEMAHYYGNRLRGAHRVEVPRTFWVKLLIALKVPEFLSYALQDGAEFEDSTPIVQEVYRQAKACSSQLKALFGWNLDDTAEEVEKGKRFRQIGPYAFIRIIINRLGLESCLVSRRRIIEDTRKEALVQQGRKKVRKIVEGHIHRCQVGRIDLSIDPIRASLYDAAVARLRLENEALEPIDRCKIECSLRLPIALPLTLPDTPENLRLNTVIIRIQAEILELANAANRETAPFELGYGFEIEAIQLSEELRDRFSSYYAQLRKAYQSHLDRLSRCQQ